MRHYIASMSRLPLLLFFTLFACPSGAFAAAEPYGWRYVEAGSLAADNVSAEVPQRDTRQSPEPDLLARRFALQLEQQELDLGPYAPSIAETLLQLARAQEAAGDASAALESLARALHLIRVNDGLYSASQGPVVRSLLDVLRRERDYEALDGRYEYFYRLYGVGRPPFNEVRWAAVMEYLRWQREALLLQLDRSPARRLLELIRNNDALLDALAEGTHAGDVWQRHRDAAVSQLHNYYLLEELILPEQPERLTSLAQRSNRIGTLEDPLDYDPQQERLANLKRSLSARVKSLLESALAIVPPGQSQALAELELALADWYQWQGNFREANARYEQIWVRLQEAGLTQLAESWFSRPLPLPDNGVFASPARDPEGRVTVLLGVSESGRARVDTRGVPDALRGDASRLRRLLQNSRFRPVVEEGKVRSRSPEERSFLLLER